MDLSGAFAEYVRACFTGIWIESHEHPEVMAELTNVCRQEEWQLLSWDIASGLSSGAGEQVGADPLAALRALDALAASESAAILVLQNFHRFLDSPEIVQTVARQILRGKLNRTFVVILSPVIEIPKELEKLFVMTFQSSMCK